MTMPGNTWNWSSKVIFGDWLFSQLLFNNLLFPSPPLFSLGSNCNLFHLLELTHRPLRTSGIKSWLRQHVLSMSWLSYSILYFYIRLSYSFSYIKKDRRMLWYLSRFRRAQDPFNTQYLPVLHISATQANFFSKVSPSTLSSFSKRSLSSVN